jgi:hypothetical protein
MSRIPNTAFQAYVVVFISVFSTTKEPFHTLCLQGVDDMEYGGAWELTKEGFLASFAGFLVTWIIIFTGIHA